MNCSWITSFQKLWYFWFGSDSWSSINSSSVHMHAIAIRSLSSHLTFSRNHFLHYYWRISRNTTLTDSSKVTTEIIPLTENVSYSNQQNIHKGTIQSTGSLYWRIFGIVIWCSAAVSGLGYATQKVKINFCSNLTHCFSSCKNYLSACSVESNDDTPCSILGLEFLGGYWQKTSYLHLNLNYYSWK